MWRVLVELSSINRPKFHSDTRTQTILLKTVLSAARSSRMLFHTQYLPVPSEVLVPVYTPGWREAIVVKHLAQGHKCHDQDSNPHFDDFNTRTWIWYMNSLGHDTLLSPKNLFLVHSRIVFAQQVGRKPRALIWQRYQKMNWKPSTQGDDQSYCVEISLWSSVLWSSCVVS